MTAQRYGSMTKVGAYILHDFIAHPLIGLINLLGNSRAEWAWRLHDWAGEVATADIAGSAATIAGNEQVVRRAAAVLSANGFTLLDDHWHGTSGRGQIVICEETEGRCAKLVS